MPLPQPASVRDRTPEFLLICERLQKQYGPTAAAAAQQQSNGTLGGRPSGAVDSQGRSQLADPRTQIQQHSEFARKAAEIGHQIHKTSVKLQKLAQLAKRTSMFDDPAQEVDELTGIIKQDIQVLNSAIAELQRISARGREENKQTHDHSNTVVDSLRTRLRDATQEFKEVLTVRTDNLKHHKERRQLFSSTADGDAAADMVPLLMRHRSSGNTQQAQQQGGASMSQPPPPPSFLQQANAQQQQQLTLAAPQDTYLSSRAEALRNVETTIVELGTIFNKLSEMVAQQGEMAIRIDENVDDTLANVTNAQAQLLKYLNTISSNRWLIMKVFAVLLIFLVIFVVFIA